MNKWRHGGGIFSGVCHCCIIGSTLRDGGAEPEPMFFGKDMTGCFLFVPYVTLECAWALEDDEEVDDFRRPYRR